MHAQWRTVEHEIDQITAASSKYDGALHILLYGAHYMELLSLYVLAEYRITLGLLLLLWISSSFLICCRRDYSRDIT